MSGHDVKAAGAAAKHSAQSTPDPVADALQYIRQTIGRGARVAGDSIEITLHDGQRTVSVPLHNPDNRQGADFTFELARRAVLAVATAEQLTPEQKLRGMMELVAHFEQGQATITVPEPAGAKIDGKVEVQKAKWTPPNDLQVDLWAPKGGSGSVDFTERFITKDGASDDIAFRFLGPKDDKYLVAMAKDAIGREVLGNMWRAMEDGPTTSKEQAQMDRIAAAMVMTAGGNDKEIRDWIERAGSVDKKAEILGAIAATPAGRKLISELARRGGDDDLILLSRLKGNALTTLDTAALAALAVNTSGDSNPTVSAAADTLRREATTLLGQRFTAALGDDARSKQLGAELAALAKERPALVQRLFDVALPSDPAAAGRYVSMLADFQRAIGTRPDAGIRAMDDAKIVQLHGLAMQRPTEEAQKLVAGIAADEMGVRFARRLDDGATAGLAPLAKDNPLLARDLMKNGRFTDNLMRTADNWLGAGAVRTDLLGGLQGIAASPRVAAADKKHIGDAIAGHRSHDEVFGRLKGRQAADFDKVITALRSAVPEAPAEPPRKDGESATAAPAPAVKPPVVADAKPQSAKAQAAPLEWSKQVFEAAKPLAKDQEKLRRAANQQLLKTYGWLIGADGKASPQEQALAISKWQETMKRIGLYSGKHDAWGGELTRADTASIARVLGQTNPAVAEDGAKARAFVEGVAGKLARQEDLGAEEAAFFRALPTGAQQEAKTKRTQAPAAAERKGASKADTASSAAARVSKAATVAEPKKGDVREVGAGVVRGSMQGDERLKMDPRAAPGGVTPAPARIKAREAAAEPGATVGVKAGPTDIEIAAANAFRVAADLPFDKKKPLVDEAVVHLGVLVRAGKTKEADQLARRFFVDPQPSIWQHANETLRAAVNKVKDPAVAGAVAGRILLAVNDSRDSNTDDFLRGIDHKTLANKEFMAAFLAQKSGMMVLAYEVLSGSNFSHDDARAYLAMVRGATQVTGEAMASNSANALAELDTAKDVMAELRLLHGVSADLARQVADKLEPTLRLATVEVAKELTALAKTDASFAAALAGRIAGQEGSAAFSRAMLAATDASPETAAIFAASGALAKLGSSVLGQAPRSMQGTPGSTAGAKTAAVEQYTAAMKAYAKTLRVLHDKEPATALVHMTAAVKQQPRMVGVLAEAFGSSALATFSGSKELNGAILAAGGAEPLAHQIAFIEYVRRTWTEARDIESLKAGLARRHPASGKVIDDLSAAERKALMAVAGDGLPEAERAAFNAKFQ